MGGASVQYWEYIADTMGLGLSVVNRTVDPAWPFMTLDWDGKIRMDCSSPYAMASLIANRDRYDLSTGNDADADRHGIVTPDAGLMNPNHYLAAAIQYLFAHREGWNPDAGIGKTLVSSSMIDNVAAKLGKKLVEVPVGFKWFVPGLVDGSIGFGGEESAGASFLTLDGKTWTTDKDGLILDLLASEILAVTGRTPSQHYADLEAEFGKTAYARVDAPANRAEGQAGCALPHRRHRHGARGRADRRQDDECAGQRRRHRWAQGRHQERLVRGAASGTEDVYKIYAESFKGPEHLALVQAREGRGRRPVLSPARHEGPGAIRGPHGFEVSCRLRPIAGCACA